MVDTVWLMTRAFELRPDNRLSSSLKLSPSGEVVSEKKWCNLADEGKGNASITVKDLKGLVCFFNVSLPQMLFGHSLVEVEQKDFERCIDEIFRQFSEAGVEVDKTAIPDMELTRIDYCKNIRVDWPAVDYTSLLASCRMKGRLEADHTPPYTALWRNKSREFTGYDKLQEILSDEGQREASGLAGDEVHNVLRLESRVKGGKVSVQRQLKRSAFGQLFDANLSRQRLLEDFSNLEVDADVKSRFRDATLSSLLSSVSGSELKGYYAMKGVYEAVGGDMERLRGLLAGKYGQRQVSRWMKRFTEFEAMQRQTRERDMLAEVKQKLSAH